ncbi:hypothetical protein LTR36_006657 [Oleoguttula mirabilis]|uniref:F-box domain-containing protein n=1 Tax=Oleoguttula mirabilis TaxID=1507867 RepID=A0AAV9JBT6_9PEZI|nr:hypothetical protein LTR36_006657 [Oleoguttula mirabilis]
MRVSVAMATAADRVFGVAELMEQILSYFDYKQLFAVERVSRDYQNALQSSKKLRRTMFLEPAAVDNPRDTRMSILNPLLRDQPLRLASCNVTFPFTCISNGIFHVSCERRDDQQGPEQATDTKHRVKVLPSWRRMRVTANSAAVIVNPGFGFKKGSLPHFSPKPTLHGFTMQRLLYATRAYLVGQGKPGYRSDDGVHGHPTLGEVADWLDTVPHDENKVRVATKRSKYSNLRRVAEEDEEEQLGETGDGRVAQSMSSSEEATGSEADLS